MQNSLVILQDATAQQGENLMALCQFSLNAAQETIDLNTRAARQLLAISARHAPAMLERPTAMPLNDIASELAQAWHTYMQASQAMARDLQEQGRQWIDTQGKQLNQAIASNLADLKTPIPANQEGIETALRSWTALTKSSFEQAAKWQKSIEQAQQNSSQALAALTGKATKAAGKRRTSAVAA